MGARFDDLKKLPPEPAARVLARCNITLETPVKAPAAALVPAVLGELADAAAWLDVMQLLAAALPPRQAVWWACLAARDLTGPDRAGPDLTGPDRAGGGKEVPRPLAAAEAWVFQPNDDSRAAAKQAIDTAAANDDTVYCAIAALYAAGTLGPGEFADFPAPPNAVAAMVQTMNMLSARANSARFDDHLQMLIDRGLDIARGGNGNVDPREPAPARAVPAAPTPPKGAS